MLEIPDSVVVRCCTVALSCGASLWRATLVGGLGWPAVCRNCSLLQQAVHRSWCLVNKQCCPTRPVNFRLCSLAVKRMAAQINFRIGDKTVRNPGHHFPQARYREQCRGFVPVCVVPETVSVNGESLHRGSRRSLRQQVCGWPRKISCLLVCQGIVGDS